MNLRPAALDIGRIVNNSNGPARLAAHGRLGR